jgi:hypothetical protein
MLYFSNYDNIFYVKQNAVFEKLLHYFRGTR